MDISRHTPHIDLPELLTVEEYQKATGCSRSAAYEHAQEIGLKLGRLWRIPKAVLVTKNVAAA